MKIDPNGPAFPLEPGWAETTTGHKVFVPMEPGLTVRAYIATQALVGNLGNNGTTGTFEDYASDAVKQADALIAELNKEPGQ